MTYDAAGDNHKLTGLSSQVSRVVTQWHSGDGEAVKRLEEGTDHPTPAPTYYLRSTVLGGAVVAELSSTGVPTKGKVYLGDTLLAERGQSGGMGWTEWKHESAVSGKQGVSDASGYYQEDGATLDPMGVDTGPPTLYYPGEGLPDERRPVSLMGAGIPNGRCSADGIEIDCAVSNQMMAHGMLAECPEGDCGPRWNPRAGAFEYVEAYGDGYVGRVGADEVYLGGGVVMNRDEDMRRLDRDPAYFGLMRPSSSPDIAAAAGWIPEPQQQAAPQDGRSSCERMADDAQRLADDARIENRRASSSYILRQFNRAFGRVTFGTYFGEGVFGWVGAQASGRNNVLGHRDYQGADGFHPDFRDTLNPEEDQVHHFGAFFSAGIAGHKIVPDHHRAGDRGDGNMGDVRLSDQSRLLGDYLRRNPGQLSRVGELIRDTICNGQEVPK